MSTEMQRAKERRLLKTVLAEMDTGLLTELKSVRLDSMELTKSERGAQRIFQAKSAREKAADERRRTLSELKEFYKQTLAAVKIRFGVDSAEYERFCGA